MAPLRQFLLLFLIGFASTSILRPHEIRAESDESLRISARDDVGTIAVRSTLQSTSVDNKGLGVVVRTEPDLVERDPTPSALLLRDDSDLNAPGAKRQAGFTSPSNRRKLLVGLGSNIITSAFWTLEFHVTKTAQSVSSLLWTNGIALISRTHGWLLHLSRTLPEPLTWLMAIRTSHFRDIQARPKSLSSLLLRSGDR